MEGRTQVNRAEFASAIQSVELFLPAITNFQITSQQISWLFAWNQ